MLYVCAALTWLIEQSLVWHELIPAIPYDSPKALGSKNGVKKCGFTDKCYAMTLISNVGQYLVRVSDKKRWVQNITLPHSEFTEKKLEMPAPYFNALSIP